MQLIEFISKKRMSGCLSMGAFQWMAVDDDDDRFVVVLRFGFVVASWF